MQSFIDKRNPGRESIPSNSDVPWEGSGDVNINTDTGKLALKTQQSILINTNDDTNGK